MPFLNWINKNQAKTATHVVPYHLLKQEAVYGSHHQNLLVQGDNLLALKALVPFYAGRVKCIFIDPPYNTQSAFEHYDDKLEHSQWLSMIYPRLILLRELLSEDGSIWIAIDDSEGHYLKVICDEIFGRRNFLGNIVWNHSVQSKGYSGKISIHHNHLLVYRKSSAFVLFDLPRTEKHNVNYANPDNDPRGPWRPGDVRNSLVRKNLMYDISVPNGGPPIKHPPKGWRFSRETFERELAEKKIIFSEDQTRIIRKIYLAEQEGRVLESLWLAHEVGTTREANKEAREFIDEDRFETPKPERLIERVLQLSTRKGDLVLDSFLGSGTTAAVAHKMNRRYIGIEIGEHARTHCIPRLQKVIEGEQGGISDSVGWKGGGGFRFCTLGESAFDSNGRIHSATDFATLAAYIWHFETGEAGQQSFDTPLLGIENGKAYYLLYNNALTNHHPISGNVLTHTVLDTIKEIFPHDGPRVIYGETSRLGQARLATENIVFKQIPYDIKMR